MPGLILEVYDLKREIYYSAEKIEIPYQEAENLIAMPTMDEQISHEEFVEKNQQVSSKISQAILSRLPEGSEITSTKVEKNAIELEYEWEKE